MKVEINKDKYAWKVNWNLLKDGMKEAAEAKKPMLVEFAVYEGCHRCEFMQKYFYSNDESIERINTDIIPILIDLAKPLTSGEKALG